MAYFTCNESNEEISLDRELNSGPLLMEIPLPTELRGLIIIRCLEGFLSIKIFQISN